MMRYVRYLIPLFVVIVMGGFLYVGLHLNPREVPSPFINKPAPDFSLQRLHDMKTTFSNKEMLGKVWLLNVWASWCVACREEHPLLISMSQRHMVPIYGLNYKDTPRDADNWLIQHGDPYVLNAVDYKGDVGINYGVYGVPETFLIDKQGIIRHKVIGPITPSELQNCVMPIVNELNKTDTANVAVISKLREKCSST